MMMRVPGQRRKRRSRMLKNRSGKTPTEPEISLRTVKLNTLVHISAYNTPLKRRTLWGTCARTRGIRQRCSYWSRIATLRHFELLYARGGFLLIS